MLCASSWFDSIWSDFICTYVEFRKPDTAWMFCSTHPTDYEFDVWGSDNMFLLLAFSYEWLNLGPYFSILFPTTYTHKYYMIFLWWQTLIHKKSIEWMSLYNCNTKLLHFFLLFFHDPHTFSPQQQKKTKQHDNNFVTLSSETIYWCWYKLLLSIQQHCWQIKSQTQLVFLF